MLRRIIIAAVVIVVPLGFWIASQYGSPRDVDFAHAIAIATSATEGEQTPKVMITAVIETAGASHAMGHLRARDVKGRSFEIDFTGSTPVDQLIAGRTFQFVGHVHGGTPPIFHATQVYE